MFSIKTAPDEDVCALFARCTLDTDKYIAITFTDGPTVHIPKGELDPSSEVKAKGDSGRLVVLGAFARRLGLNLVGQDQNRRATRLLEASAKQGRHEANLARA